MAQQKEKKEKPMYLANMYAHVKTQRKKKLKGRQ